MSVLFVFVDGIGLAEADPQTNPFAAAHTPLLHSLIGGNLTRDADGVVTQRASVRGIDALLDTPGLPQSGTGQTALLTGRNAAHLFGRHFGPWVPVMLREIVATENVLTRARQHGKRVAFANAYPEELIARADDDYAKLYGPLRAGPPLAALGAGLLTRTTADLVEGSAVASEITNDGWREHLKRVTVPTIAAEDAGRNLAAIANTHDLTMFAHYATDTAGHSGELHTGVAAVERLDSFLRGVLSQLAEDVTTVVASDHGNLEDVRAGHTRNPAVLLAVGPEHERVTASVRSLVDAAAALLALA